MIKTCEKLGLNEPFYQGFVLSLHIKCAQSQQFCSVKTSPFGVQSFQSHCSDFQASFWHWFPEPHSIISLSELSLQTVLYKIVAFSPFLLFSLLGSAFKDEIRVCWGRTAVSAHCVADLAQAALGRAAPGPEHLEFIQFIYKAELPWVALPMVSLLVQYLILELSAYFHFDGGGDLPLVTNS